MKAFFRNYLAALAAGFTFFGLGFLLILASSGSGETAIPTNSVLKLSFSGTMQDYVPRSSFPNLEQLMADQNVMSMEEIIFNIDKATYDESIESIFLNLNVFSAGSAQLREIRDALKGFKAEGKKVYAYGVVINRAAYYLGSVADELWLSPTGMMEWNGLASAPLYMKGALDKLGVTMNLIRGSDNAFKSAGEPFITTEMSEANKLQLSSYLNSVWETTLADLEGDGRLTAGELNTIADEGVILTPEDALANQMVDSLLYEDEVLEFFGMDGTGDDLAFVSLSKYNRELDGRKHDALNRVAVIYAEGDVSLGNSSPGTMGSATIVKALREVRNNDRIKAVVLRVNSPGGVSLAGDAMWREMNLLREAKPVVVSMGNVAASAGYQISAPADTILVSPQTITGSIGVFMLYPTAETLMHDHLGVSFQPVGTNAMSSFGTFDRPLTEAEYKLLQRNVDDFYTHFKWQVSSGRNLDEAHVDSIARGRVWTGAQALNLGLADMEGGLLKAIEVAADMANLEDRPMISSYPIPTDPLDEWLKQWAEQNSSSQIKAELGPLAPLYEEWKSITPRMGIQKRMMDYSMEYPL